MPHFPRLNKIVMAIITLNMLAGCALFEMHRSPTEPPANNVGSSPTLPAAADDFIPTVRVAPAIGWPVGARPVSAAGTSVTPYASGLEHPRWLFVLPNGDVLVAETNAPEKPEDSRGLKGKAMKFVQGVAGANAPTANRITLLRASRGNGIVDVRSSFIEGLNCPYGMALVGNDLYVADTDAILKFHYVSGATSVQGRGTVVTALPAGTINHHWTKNILASLDGSTLYASVGSNSNAAENGIDAEEGRAAIYQVDLATGSKRVFATGLRNPNGMGWEPTTGALWTVVNERDELGDDLVPDYLTSVTAGAFYGWPYSYYGAHLDPRVAPQRPDLVAKALPPDFALGSHVAPLGLAFAGATALPPPFQNGVFIGEHGSWNRSPPVGYSVVFVRFAEGHPVGQPLDVLTGFVNHDGKAYGRPVGVALDASGALLVGDDVGNVVWRVTRSGGDANR